MRWIILLCLIAPNWALAQSSQQTKEKKSLAEVAREARDKKAQVPQATRVITNSDLKNLRSKVGQGTSPEGVMEAEGEGADSEAGEETPDSGEESAASSDLSEEELQEWRQAFTEANDQLKMAVNEGLVLQLRMNNLNNAFFRQSDGSTQQRIQAQLQETLEQIEQNKKAQLDAREAIRKLQTDARQAGLTQNQITDLTGELPKASSEITSPETIQ